MKNFAVLTLTLFLIACQTTEVRDESTLANLSSKLSNETGISQQRLQRIAPVMQSYIDSEKLMGISTLVAHKGKIVHWDIRGMQDKKAAIPMSEDTIYRIYSMTKPITAVAALTLWEQGKFHMDDPISKYLPELADLQVYVSGSGEDMQVEKAKYPIKIIDLFMHTAGFSYGFSDNEVDKRYQAMFARTDITREEILAEIATLPLNHHPGTQWHYGINTDIIGFLVEKLSGRKLGDYMQEVVFDPLGMNDTSFYVPEAKLSRLSKIYTADQKTGKTIHFDNEPLGDYKSDPDIHYGGAGLVSTMADYLKFAQMMLNGGELNGSRILGRKTVEYLTSNHLSEDLIPFSSQAPGEGYALAMSVTVDANKVGYMSSDGNYGWGGLASTYFRVDPKEQLIIIGMSQFIPSGFHAYQNDLRNLVYQALE